MAGHLKIRMGIRGGGGAVAPYDTESESLISLTHFNAWPDNYKDESSELKRTRLSQWRH